MAIPEMSSSQMSHVQAFRWCCPNRSRRWNVPFPAVARRDEVSVPVPVFSKCVSGKMWQSINQHQPTSTNNLWCSRFGHQHDYLSHHKLLVDVGSLPIAGASLRRLLVQDDTILFERPWLPKAQLTQQRYWRVQLSP